ncbi:MAG: cyclase family protein [Saprospiraceae bacterium]|nr:cyclase family protein [Saprospiraceae bacterium]
MKYHHSIISVLLIFVLGNGCKPGTGLILPKDGHWIDLSYSFDASTPYWPTSDGFKLDTVFQGLTDKGYFYSAFSFQSAEHGGTHIDAPVHFAEGKQTVDEIPLSSLTGSGIVIDVRDSVNAYIDYQIAKADFAGWEKNHGKIPDHSIVLLRTGFGKYWPDKKKYLGTDITGERAIPFLHFPGLDPEAAQWLVAERNIKAIGIDTPSIDYGRSSDFQSHRILFAANIPAFENLANLDQLPDHGIYIVALPMKIKGGSGGPLRIAALIL